MRIVHLISSLGSGGAEKQISALLPELAKTENDIHLICCQGGPNFDSIKQSNVTVHQIQSSNNYSLNLALKIFLLLRQLRPDVIQTWLPKMDILGGLSGFMLRVPFILSERSSGENYRDGLKSEIRTWIGKRAAFVVANSEGGATYWKSRISEKKVLVFRNAVVSARLKNIDLLDLVHTDNKIVIFAGRLNKVKNVHLFLDAISKIIKGRNDVTCFIFGEGPEHQDLVQKVEVLNLTDKIKICGFTKDLPSWLNIASVFVSISNFEGHPNVVIEAASLECPLVLSDIPAHREFFSDDAACYVNKNSVESIENGILSVLNNVNVANKKTIIAKSIVSKFSIEAMVNSYLALYKKICHENNS